MDGEEVIGEVAEKDCAGTVMGELVSAGAADTKGRVGAFNFWCNSQMGGRWRYREGGVCGPVKMTTFPSTLL